MQHPSACGQWLWLGHRAGHRCRKLVSSEAALSPGWTGSHPCLRWTLQVPLPHWLLEIPSCPQWQLCDRTPPVLAAFSSLHPHGGFLGHLPKKLPALESSSEFTSGEPNEAIIVPALRGSRWGFPSACKAQNGACKYRRCSQPSSSNTPRSAWSLCLGSCCFRRLLCLSLPLHPAQAKSFWIHLSTRLLSEAFPDHLLHLARSGLPPLCFHWLPSSVRAFTPSMTILCGPSLLPIILRGQRPCLSALWFFGGKREHAYVS